MKIFKHLIEIYCFLIGILCWISNFGIEWASWKYKFYTYHGFIMLENVFYTLLFSAGAFACLVGLVLALLSWRKKLKEKIDSPITDVFSCLFTGSFIAYSVWQVSMNLNIYLMYLGLN